MSIRVSQSKCEAFLGVADRRRQMACAVRLQAFGCKNKVCTDAFLFAKFVTAEFVCESDLPFADLRAAKWLRVHMKQQYDWKV